MATPIAHGLTGIMCLGVVHCVRPRTELPYGAKLGLVGALAACLPDFDILVSFALAGNPALLHGGPTHSLVFALFAGALTVALAQLGDAARRFKYDLGLLVLLAVLSHVLIDWSTGPRPGMHPSYGARVLWPFDEQRYSLPVTLFRGVKHGDWSVWLSWPNLQTALVELLVFPPLAYLVWKLGPSRLRTLAGGAPR